MSPATSPSAKLRLAAVGAVVAMSLTACGSSASEKFVAQSAQKISDQAKADTKAASSLTVDGSITTGGNTIDLKLSADKDGNCTGTMGVAGGTAEILGVGGAEYLKGDEAFWKASAGTQAAQVVALLGDKWAKLPSGSSQLASFCDLDQLLSDLGSSSKTEKITKGKVTEVGGAKAIELTAVGSDGTTHIWVATEGKHHVLKLTSDGTDSGSVQFSDYGKPVDAKAPAEGEIVDLGALG